MSKILTPKIERKFPLNPKRFNAWLAQNHFVMNLQPANRIHKMRLLCDWICHLFRESISNIKYLLHSCFDRVNSVYYWLYWFLSSPSSKFCSTPKFIQLAQKSNSNEWRTKSRTKSCSNKTRLNCRNAHAMIADRRSIGAMSSTLCCAARILRFAGFVK